ncbi:MAG: tetratricopeptide repeat protein [Candidatus Obscuribacterales bacterium]|nr:tetratricopeptide repeat protein [Candidatus Obscuribacterales bacterium]
MKLKNNWDLFIKAGARLYSEGDFRAAVDNYEAALNEARAAANNQDGEAIALEGLGQCYTAMAEYSRAQDTFKEVLKLKESNQGPESIETLEVLIHLLVACHKGGKTQEAMPIAERVYQLGLTIFGPANIHMAKITHGIAKFLLDVGQSSDSESMFQYALQILSSNPDEQNLYKEAIVTDYTNALRNWGRETEAQQILQQFGLI